ncbi:MAG: histidinol dehydrogenase, partial [Sneathiellaceae bacterium]
MPLRLDAADPGFAAAFDRMVADRREQDADVGETVAAIVADVRARGDAALLDYTERFDRVRPAAGGLAIGAGERAAAVATVPAEVRAALALAAERIRAFHLRQMPQDDRYTDAAGVRLGQRWRPVAAAVATVPAEVRAALALVRSGSAPSTCGICRRSNAPPMPPAGGWANA